MGYDVMPLVLLLTIGSVFGLLVLLIYVTANTPAERTDWYGWTATGADILPPDPYHATLVKPNDSEQI